MSIRLEDRVELVLFLQQFLCESIRFVLSRRYRWSLLKTLEFLNSRRPDLEIRASFIHQLTAHENRLVARGLGPKTTKWTEIYDQTNDFENEELLLRNTYLNAQMGPFADLSAPSAAEKIPKIKWTDMESKNKVTLATVIESKQDSAEKDHPEESKPMIVITKQKQQVHNSRNGKNPSESAPATADAHKKGAELKPQHSARDANSGEEKKVQTEEGGNGAKKEEKGKKVSGEESRAGRRVDALRASAEDKNGLRLASSEDKGLLRASAEGRVVTKLMPENKAVVHPGVRANIDSKVPQAIIGENNKKAEPEKSEHHSKPVVRDHPKKIALSAEPPPKSFGDMQPTIKSQNFMYPEKPKEPIHSVHKNPEKVKPAAQPSGDTPIGPGIVQKIKRESENSKGTHIRAKAMVKTGAAQEAPEANEEKIKALLRPKYNNYVGEGKKRAEKLCRFR